MKRRQKLQHAVNVLLTRCIDESVKKLSGPNRLKLFLESTDLILSQGKELLKKRGDLLKLCLLFGIPPRSECAFTQLLERVAHLAKKRYDRETAMVVTGDAEREDEGVPKKLRRLRAGDVDRLVEWWVERARQEKEMFFVRNELDGVAAVVGGSGFEAIDDRELWMPRCDELVDVLEEGLLHASGLRVRAVVNSLCFAAGEREVAKRIAEQLYRVAMTLCMLPGAAHGDLMEAATLIVQGASFVAEVAKRFSLGGERALERVLNDAVVPKVERLLVAHGLGNGPAMAFLKSLETSKSSQEHDEHWSHYILHLKSNKDEL